MGAARARCAVQRCRTCAIETRRFALRPRLTPSCATLMATPDCGCKFAQPVLRPRAGSVGAPSPPVLSLERIWRRCLHTTWRAAAVSRNSLPGVGDELGDELYSVSIAKDRLSDGVYLCQREGEEGEDGREIHVCSWHLWMKYMYLNLLHPDSRDRVS